MGLDGLDGVHGRGSARIWHSIERDLPWFGGHRLWLARQQEEPAEDAAARRHRPRRRDARHPSTAKLHQRSFDSSHPKALIPMDLRHLNPSQSLDIESFKFKRFYIERYADSLQRPRRDDPGA